MMLIRSNGFVGTLKIARRVIGLLGWRWAVFRFRHALKLRAGYFERNLPIRPWRELPIGEELVDRNLACPSSYLEYRRTTAPIFFFRPTDRFEYGDILVQFDEKRFKNCIELADRICQGYLPYFDYHIVHTGLPPDWYRNYFTGEQVTPGRHWSRIGDFEHGDIKIIWEPSRFAFIYALVRAYWRTADEKYAETFWELVEDWREKNPPQAGPNWKCGQEIAIRIMAWCFGLYGFLDSSASTPRRVMDMAQMIAVSCHRIEANLDYALSQRNNHGISEATGLWTVGLLFPEFRRAEAWLEKGRKVLETLGRNLIYDDGSFVQHSVNYHRLMLHDYLWAIRLGDLHGQPFSDELQVRVARAGQFLYQLQDAESGQVPYYGQNDGALILPLNNCDYLDFRPVIQATHYLASGKRLYDSGPWDEDLLWLFGPEALSSDTDSVPRTDLRAETGGYYTMRSKEGFAFVRCATYKDRPGQGDMLHLDLWWQGQNIAVDAGTYSYNAPKPWNNPLAHTAYHNTVTVDGMDQMDRVGKFLWVPWLRGYVLHIGRSGSGNLAYWEGAHDGYQRLSDPVVHRRAILQIAGDTWLVLDYLKGEDEHDFRLHWLFPDWPYKWTEESGKLVLQTPEGTYYVQIMSSSATAQWSLIRADETTPRGWRAPYYSYREPAISLALNAYADTALFGTLFTPQVCHMEIDRTEMHLAAQNWRVNAQITCDNPLALLSTITLTGTQHDALEIG